MVKKYGECKKGRSIKILTGKNIFLEGCKMLHSGNTNDYEFYIPSKETLQARAKAKEKIR